MFPDSSSEDDAVVVVWSLQVEIDVEVWLSVLLVLNLPSSLDVTVGSFCWINSLTTVGAGDAAMNALA